MTAHEAGKLRRAERRWRKLHRRVRRHMPRGGYVPADTATS